MVQEATIRSQLLYGLESTAMNETVKHSLHIFQQKCLRKIVKLKTSAFDRANDNKATYNNAQAHIHRTTSTGIQERMLKPHSQVYEERQIKVLNQLIEMDEDSPSVLAFKPNTIIPIDFTEKEGVTRRSGKPGVQRIETTMQKLWTLIGTHISEEVKDIPLNSNNQQHIEAVLLAAELDLHEITPNYMLKT